MNWFWHYFQTNVCVPNYLDDSTCQRVFDSFAGAVIAIVLLTLVIVVCAIFVYITVRRWLRAAIDAKEIVDRHYEMRKRLDTD